MPEELAPESLRRTFDLAGLTCQSSREATPGEAIIGQERAVRALRFGLAIQSTGFNIYIAGPPGTGRTTAARQFLEEVAGREPTPDDWCYVNNFDDSYYPTAIHLPAGRARQFQKDMHTLIEEVRRELRRVFESEEYANKREETVRSFQKQRDALFAEINRLAQEQGFVIRSSQIGLFTIPTKEGKPLSEEEFMALPQEEQAAIAQRRQGLEEEIKAFLRQARALEKALGEALENLDQQVALFALNPFIEELQETYGDLEEIGPYLEAVRDDILANLNLFRNESAKESPPPPGTPSPPLRKYQVNVLVDNGDIQGAPVIIETNPTYANLFGRIEKEAQFGTLVTDFTLIRGGSLHRANGGYLVLPVEELLRNPLSWDTLKLALKNGQIIIEEPAERVGFITTKGLSPEPIPLQAKVILIGRPETYHLLYNLDEDFRELFKVKADFDTTMGRDEAGINDYISFICRLCENEALLHLDASAIAQVIEHGSRLAQDQNKLSTRFGELSDVIREAHHYAAQENASAIQAGHVQRAIEERFYRSALLQEKSREMIERGLFLIDVTGEEVGQVNGLTVLNLGDISFGRPGRITASIGLGQEGIVDIERAAKLGGPIHTKGVLILAGYLNARYAQDKPLSLSARLVFEQSYSSIDGDSASGAELCALLSALADLPIRQGIAVTGSVNQKGEIQAVGGVNEKVEGFYEICKAKGLTGDQGVIIPQANVQNLMLKEEVVQAVREGRFHLWAVRTVDEAIELLTGVPAGRRQKDGTFPEGTVNARVDRRLRELAEAIRRFGRPEPRAGAGEETPSEEPATEQPPEDEGQTDVAIS